MKKSTNTSHMNFRASHMHGSGNMNVSEKAKDFKGTLKRLIKYLSVYKLSIFTVLLFAVISTVFTIVGPKVLGTATTELYNGLIDVIAGRSNSINFDHILNILLFLLLLYIISFVFSYLQGFIMTGISMKVTYRLRDDISKKINKVPLKYFDTTSYGEVLSRVTNDVDTLSQSLNQSITQLITSVTTIIGIAIMMFTISVQMTIVALLIIPISFIFISIIIRKSQVHFLNQQKYLGIMNGHVEEMYAGHNVMKAFNGEANSIAQFDSYNEKLFVSAWKSQFLSGLMMPIMNFVSNVGYVIVCILGGYLAVHDGLPVGDIQAFIQYVRQFTQPIVQISNISNVLQQTVASSERVFEFLDEDEEIKETSNPIRINENSPGEGEIQNISGNVKFDHVKFGYVPEKIIIHDFSADISQGQKIAIVGPTGAGKTTMVKLLMRFYDVNSGAILIDGHNIKDFTRNDLRSMFGMVLQDTWLYNASVMDNIKYGKLDATDEDVIKAAKLAQVDHFIRTLPGGYGMILNEEASNVSQGQKQLLTIARAILADPKILILDEATSSVDTRTEVMIRVALDNLMKGRTSFIIAHRLSTIRDADLILVMKDGDIIEQGNHDELMAKNGFYSKLYNSQFEH